MRVLRIEPRGGRAGGLSAQARAPSRAAANSERGGDERARSHPAVGPGPGCPASGQPASLRRAQALQAVRVSVGHRHAGMSSAAGTPGRAAKRARPRRQVYLPAAPSASAPEVELLKEGRLDDTDVVRIAAVMRAACLPPQAPPPPRPAACPPPYPARAPQAHVRCAARGATHGAPARSRTRRARSADALALCPSRQAGRARAAGRAGEGQRDAPRGSHDAGCGWQHARGVQRARPRGRAGLVCAGARRVQACAGASCRVQVRAGRSCTEMSARQQSRRQAACPGVSRRLWYSSGWSAGRHADGEPAGGRAYG